MSAVGNFIKGAGKAVFGGDSKLVQGSAYAKMTPEEQKRLGDIESQINSMFGSESGKTSSNLAQSQEIQNLFSNNLKTFLSKDPGIDQNQLEQATKFIDQTFTTPTQQALQQQQADFQSQAQARAAALGRNPNADIATQQAIAGEGMRQSNNLQAERGARIQQSYNDLSNQGLASLNAGLQGSNFLNNLTQQSFNNRLNLLNGRTGLAQIYQQNRQQTGGQMSTSPGLLGTLTSGVGQIAGLGGALQTGGKLLGIGQAANVAGTPGEYRSSGY